MKAKYTILYADANGESHFKDAEIELKETVVAPNTPPIGSSIPIPAVACLFWAASPGESMGWHTAPRRQFLFLLAGQTEVEASDGEIRNCRPGDILLAENTTGKGNNSRVIGSGDVLIAIVPLAN